MTMKLMPRPLYKYLDARYAEALVKSGCIQIGTLSKFRKMEADAERGDDSEGRLTLHSPPGRRVYGGDDIPLILRHPGIYIGPGALATEGDRAIVIESRIADLFVYCTTEVFDADCAKSFGSGLPARCVRIDAPEVFFITVNAALRVALRAKGISIAKPCWGNCEYRDRVHCWELDDLPAQWLLKPARYSKQREVRVQWEPNPMQELEPIVLQVPELTRLCTLF